MDSFHHHVRHIFKFSLNFVKHYLQLFVFIHVIFL